MSVLARICEDKRVDVAHRKQLVSLAALERRAQTAPSVRGFTARLRSAVARGEFGLISEIKRASPSKGAIRNDVDPPALARAYEAGGATCLSVLTDTPYFGGQDADLQTARAAVGMPALRKDFMLDPYQIVEARTLGADCVLLILAAIDDTLARELADVAGALGMDVLTEVHSQPEMERAVSLGAKMIGINNRDLSSLRVDLATTEHLAPLAPPGTLLVGESGIANRADLDRLSQAGVHCFLVGESLMRQADPAAAVRSLLSPLPSP